MDFKSCTDEELIALINSSTPYAIDELLSRYKTVVNSVSRRFFLVNYDVEDWSQEGFIALIKAILDYDPTKNASFKTYAVLCVKNKLTDIIRAKTTSARKPANDLVSLDDGLSESVTANGETNPEMLVINEETYQNRLNYLHSQLSPKEVAILNLYLEGISYAEISTALGVTTKKVDNSVQKIKRTLKKSINS